MVRRKSKVGRKTVITKTVLRKLEEAFLLGCTDREACLYANISETALYDYQSKNRLFTERKRVLKINPILKARRTIIDNLEDKKVAMWFLERKQKAEFGTKFIQSEDTYDPGLTDEEKQTLRDLLEQEGYTVEDYEPVLD